MSDFSIKHRAGRLRQWLADPEIREIIALTVFSVGLSAAVGFSLLTADEETLQTLWESGLLICHSAPPL